MLVVCWMLTFGSTVCTNLQADDFPLSHVDSTSSRVFDKQQGASILQQTIGRPLSGIVFDEAICTMLLTMS